MPHQHTATDAAAPRKALRLPDVIAQTALPRTTIYRLAREGKFPAPFKLSERASAWDAEAVNDWLESRMRGAA